MKTTILMMAIATGAVMSSGAAEAQRGQPMVFEELDLNGDGQITLEEMQNQRDVRFHAADTNGDGALSEAEMLAAAEGRAQDRATRMIERMLDRLDANDDGLIQQSEMPERDGDRMSKRFERVDADGDGAISAEEFEEVRDGGGKHGRKGDRG